MLGACLDYALHIECLSCGAEVLQERHKAATRGLGKVRPGCTCLARLGVLCSTASLTFGISCRESRYADADMPWMIVRTNVKCIGVKLHVRSVFLAMSFAGYLAIYPPRRSRKVYGMAAFLIIVKGQLVLYPQASPHDSNPGQEQRCYCVMPTETRLSAPQTPELRSHTPQVLKNSTAWGSSSSS